MIKKILIITFLVLVGVGSFLGHQAYTYPERMYSKWLRAEAFDEWFFIPNYTVLAFSNQTKSIERNINRGKDAESVWKTFHVTDVMLPLPFRHPLYTVLPIVTDPGAKRAPELGFEITNSRKKTLFSIRLLPKTSFSFKDNKQKLFKIPIFKQYISSVSEKEKWRDIFEMKFQDKGTDIKQMVYQLYILDQRMSYLPKTTKTFGFIPDAGLADIEYVGKDKDFKTELIMLLKGGTIHSFLVTTRLGEPEARAIRGRILRELKIVPDSENMARAIYEEFKALPYKQQINNDGFIFLFSAWSHTTEDKEFFRVMIQFLERGQDNFIFLEPLYAFAYSRFGSSFSRFDYRLKEKAEEEFKRKLQEEEKQEAKDLLNKQISDINLKDLSEQDRINYQLKKAKEKKANSTNDKTLIVD